MGITVSYGNGTLSCFQFLCSQSSAKVMLNIVKNLSLSKTEFVDRTVTGVQLVNGSSGGLDHSI